MFETFQLDAWNRAVAEVKKTIATMPKNRSKAHRQSVYAALEVVQNMRLDYVTTMADAIATADKTGLAQTVAFYSRPGDNESFYSHTHALANVLRAPYVTCVVTILNANYFS